MPVMSRSSLTVLLAVAMTAVVAGELEPIQPFVTMSAPTVTLATNAPMTNRTELAGDKVPTFSKEGDQHIYGENHESLFPLELSDYVGFVLCLLGLMLAAGGGIGGGGILIPIYILVMNFSPKHAIPLSSVTVLGGAVANIILNVRQRHPIADRPLIDWFLILVMEPVTMAGTVLGTLINSMLSETTIVIMLIVLLSYTARKTLQKAIYMYRKETLDILEQEKLAATEELRPIVRLSTNDDTHDDKQQESVNPELAAILEEERQPPVGAILMLVALFFVVFVINFLKGANGFSPVGIECGSFAFWIANAMILVTAVAVTSIVRFWLVRRYELKNRVGYEYVEGDILWDSQATIIYPSICALAGLSAGLFGIGGGIVKGPLMLAMGVHPTVASATGATMLLFTSLTAFTSYIVFGLLIHQYAIVCFWFGFIATLLGQLLLTFFMAKHARNSYIAFSIGFVVLISAVLMTIQSILSTAKGEKHSSGGICGVDT